MINIGLIGYGHWGPDHARIFNGQVDSLVVAVADPDERRLAAAQDQIPFVSATSDQPDPARPPRGHHRRDRDPAADALRPDVAVHRCSTVALLRSSRASTDTTGRPLVFQATVPGLCPLRAA